jgi:hypothetical protein
MIHTYREPERSLPNSKPLRLLVYAMPSTLIIVIWMTVVIVTDLGHGVTWAIAKDAAWGLGFSLIVAWYLYRHRFYYRCKEIRLSDDGTCELEAESRLVRLHVRQIRSVERLYDEGTTAYTIRFEGGKTEIEDADGWADFEDFLTRLKVLNPGVELIGFPRERLARFVHPRDRAVANTDVKRLIRSALFPLIVIVLLVYLASQTLVGK